MSNLEARVKKLEADIEMIVTTVRGLVTVEQKTGHWKALGMIGGLLALLAAIIVMRLWWGWW